MGKKKLNNNRIHGKQCNIKVIQYYSDSTTYSFQISVQLRVTLRFGIFVNWNIIFFPASFQLSVNVESVR